MDMSITQSESSRPLDIIIVGAGIAGLACARALREHNVTVLEQSQMKREVGAAIHIGSNASKIALKWGMDLQKLGSPECGYFREYDAYTGNTLHEMAVDARSLYGAPWLLNHRVDLHNELRRLATDEDIPARPATIKTSSKVVSVDCEAGIVKLATGEELKADVIIGADGIRSNVRTSIFGRDIVALPTGHSAYRCLIPAETIKADATLAYLVDKDKGAITTWLAEDRRIVAYPCRGCTFLNIAAMIPDKFLGEESVDSWSAEGSIDEMLNSFKEFAPEARRLLRCAPSCGLWQLRDHTPHKYWARGRTIIVGDAAHAMLPHQGQGGSQSLEDAEAVGVLLSGLTKADVDAIPERLKIVEAIRLERASLIQGYSRLKALGPRKGENIPLNTGEFLGYLFDYDGSIDWAKRKGISVPDIKPSV